VLRLRSKTYHFGRRPIQRCKRWASEPSPCSTKVHGYDIFWEIGSKTNCFWHTPVQEWYRTVPAWHQGCNSQSSWPYKI